MSKVYNLRAYRACRLLDGFTQQTGQVRKDLLDFGTHSIKASHALEKSAQALGRIDSLLEKHKLSINETRKRNEACQKALDCDDIEELIKVRDELSEACSRYK